MERLIVRRNSESIASYLPIDPEVYQQSKIRDFKLKQQEMQALLEAYGNDDSNHDDALQARKNHLKYMIRHGELADSNDPQHDPTDFVD
jgi:hypothetical protein